MHVEPADSVTPLIWIADPFGPTEPQFEVVYPPSVAVVDGAGHSGGTATSICPSFSPPAAAV